MAERLEETARDKLLQNYDPDDDTDIYFFPTTVLDLLFEFGFLNLCVTHVLPNAVLTCAHQPQVQINDNK